MKFKQETQKLKMRIRRPGRHSKRPNKSANNKRSRGQG